MPHRISRVLTMIGLLIAVSGSVTGPAFAQSVDGKKVFNKCKACHTATAATNKIGPHLQNIVGRKAGTIEGFKYSKAMKDSGIIWNDETLDGYLENPRKYMPKNKMAFVGLKKPEERKAVIEYLKNPE